MANNLVGGRIMSNVDVELAQDAIAANRLRFCYQCQRNHAPDEMIKIATRGGPRWRCKAGLQAARQSVRERDHHGRGITASNQAISERSSDTMSEGLRAYRGR